MKWSRPSEASVKTRHFFQQLIRSSKLKDIDKNFATFSTFASPPLVISWVWFGVMKWSEMAPILWKHLKQHRCLFHDFYAPESALLRGSLDRSNFDRTEDGFFPKFLRWGDVSEKLWCFLHQCCGFGERKNAGFSRYIDAIDMHLGK